MTSESGIEAALLPCPFCGCEAHSVGYGPYHVICKACGARTTTAYTMPEKGAVELWNRRHPPASREDGLRSERDDIIIAWLRQRGFIALADEAEQTFQPAALIPTKPEAKEDYSDTIAWLRDDAERRTDGIVGNEGRLKPEQTHQWRAAEALSRISAALQSKKPE